MLLQQMMKNLSLSNAQPGPTKLSHQPGAGFSYFKHWPQNYLLNENFWYSQWGFPYVHNITGKVTWLYSDPKKLEFIVTMNNCKVINSNSFILCILPPAPVNDWFYYHIQYNGPRYGWMVRKITHAYLQ